MTNVQSKLVPVAVTCKEYVHPWTDSCWHSTAGLLIQGTVHSARIYSVVYLLSLMTRGRIPTRRDIKRTIQGIMQSTAFLSTNAFAFAFFACLVRSILGGFYFPTVAFVPAFLASLCAIYVERPQRRILLTLYVANVATETAWRMAVSRGLVKSVPYGQAIIFSISSSVLLYLYRLGKHHQHKDSLFNILRFVVGNEEAGRPAVEAGEDERAQQSPAEALGVEGVEGAVGAGDRVGRQQRRNHYSDISYLVRIYVQLLDKIKSQSKHKSCPHNYSCLYYSISGGSKQFLVGFGLQVTLKFILQLKKIVQLKLSLKKVIFNKDTLKLGMFLGGFAFLFRSVSCSLRHVTGFDHPLFALPAGLAASLAYTKYPDITVALYIMWKALQICWNLGIDKGFLPDVPGFQTFLYCSSTALLFHAGLMEPMCLRESYWKFLQGISGARLAVMDRRAFDVWGLETSKFVAEKLKQTNTQATKVKFAFR